MLYILLVLYIIAILYPLEIKILYVRISLVLMTNQRVINSSELRMFLFSHIITTKTISSSSALPWTLLSLPYFINHFLQDMNTKIYNIILLFSKRLQPLKTFTSFIVQYTGKSGKRIWSTFYRLENKNSKRLNRSPNFAQLSVKFKPNSCNCYKDASE